MHLANDRCLLFSQELYNLYTGLVAFITIILLYITFSGWLFRKQTWIHTYLFLWLLTVPGNILFFLLTTLLYSTLRKRYIIAVLCEDVLAMCASKIFLLMT